MVPKSRKLRLSHFFFYRNKQYDFGSFMHSIHSINLAIFFCVVYVKRN